MSYNKSVVNYSDKSVSEKLGIKPDTYVVVINQPSNYRKLIGSDKTNVTIKLSKDSLFIHYFTHSKQQLEKDFPKLKKHLAKDGLLWISNLKRQKDFNQNDVIEIGLKNGLVDVKIASINGDWSAMKFVYRVKDH